MNKTGIPYLDFAWNPGGFGCSKGCPTCWARRQTHSPACPPCPDCRAFRVHLHAERLTGKAAPESRKKPAVVGVQFTGELFDPQRPTADVQRILDAAWGGLRHTMVFLTQQYRRADDELGDWYKANVKCSGHYAALVNSWHIGTTCRNTDQYGQAAKLFGNCAWRWWVSAEPIAGPILPEHFSRPVGIVIGADNQVTAPFRMDWIRQTATAFAYAGVPVYVKQLWMFRCGRCCIHIEEKPGMYGCNCMTPQWRRVLVTDPALFPEDLRLRDLPWTLTTKKP